jgi:hypothetical protein
MPMRYHELVQGQQVVQKKMMMIDVEQHRQAKPQAKNCLIESKLVVDY